MSKEILCSIRGAERLALRGCSGDANAKTIFTGWLDDDWNGWGLGRPSPERPNTSVCVDELVENANYATMFAGVPKERFFTPAQVTEFVRDKQNRRFLASDGRATFFPVRVENKEAKKPEERVQFFVARVCLIGSEPMADVRHFYHDCVWVGGSGSHVVRPRL